MKKTTVSLNTYRPQHIAVVGIDGSGKSSCYEGLLKILAGRKRIAGIGDQILVTQEDGQLQVPGDIIRVKVKYALSIIIKLCKHKFFYQISKLLELIERSKIHDTIAQRYAPETIITDGAPLINMLGWGRYYHPQFFNRNEYAKSVYYLTRKKKLPFKKALYYLMHIPEMFVINNIYWVQLKIPDIVIFLKVDPKEALNRIMKRGKEIQVHERKEFLKKLQEAYVFSLSILQENFGMKVFEINTNHLSQEDVLSKAEEIIMKKEKLADINVIATTISGSIKDWEKLDHMEEEFNRYHENIKVHIVDSHLEAFERTKEIVNLGGRKLISAGGAGTFNSVLEGCCVQDVFPENLRLAFLRKGSADLIGKVLNIPDDLYPAVKIISESIKNDKTIDSDILEIKAKGVDGEFKKYHMIGFGGAGIFGDIPYFTESRFIKYYKGILGYLFGDRGPFMTGANLAILRYYLHKLRKKKMKLKIIADNIETSFENYSNILIMNGDLGKHFPVAKGLPLDSGDFQVILAKDRGIFMTYKQLIQSWKGNLSQQKDALDIKILRTKSLRIIPEKEDPYCLNVDGQLRNVIGDVEYRLFGKVKLITG